MIQFYIGERRKDTKNNKLHISLVFGVIVILIGVCFPPSIVASEDWHNFSFGYRKLIMINHMKIDTTLRNFPIMINLPMDANLAAHTQPDGDDIVFIDVQGNKLNHEIELYDNITGRLVAWVNIANLSSSADTILYMYYGNSTCGSQQNPQGTWNTDYLTVHHMNETGNIIDSTSHALNAVNYGTATEPNGKIGGCRYFDNLNDRYDFGAASALNPGLSSWTISLWTKASYVNNVNILQKWGSSAGFYLKMYNGWGGYNYFQVSDGVKNTYRYWDTSGTDGNWHYLTVVINRNTNKLDVYLDGTLHNGGGNGNIAGFGSITTTSSFNFYGGTSSRHDEFTISTTVRNASWIKTCYNNQNNPTGFYSLGSQEQAPSNNQPPIVSAENPVDNSVNVNINAASVSVTIQDPEGKHLNWTITTSPDIGSSVGTNEFNGTKTCAISGLAYSTMYTWMVKANDGSRWTNKTYSFTTQNAPVNNPPLVTNPNPANMSTSVPITLSLLTITIQDPEGKRINWTITTSPNIGSNAGTNEYNGTKTCVIAGLVNSTTYIWTVKANDGSRWTNKTYSFTTQVATSSWWNTAWLYRKEINIDHTKVDTNLKNFPVIINLSSDADLAAHAQPDGDDIVFTDAQGIKLNHEIELYTSATGRLVAWVNVTSLSSTTDTKLYLYYGNALCSSQQNPQGTWNTDYLMVHHMNETGNIIDSTFHALNAVNYGTTTESNGKIDGSRYFDSTTDRYDFGAASSLNPGLSSWTISLWTKTSFVSGQNILQKYGTSGFYLKMYNNGAGGYNYVYLSDGTRNTYRYWDTSGTDGNWHYLTIVINRNTNTLDVYLDGVLHNGPSAGSLANLGSITTTSNFNFRGGSNGRHDEFTLSTIARNASWIKTSYNNQNNPSRFLNLNNISEVIPPDDSHSPIKKYFTIKKIIWTFDDYWIHLENHPPHKGFDGLSQQIHTYGGYVNIMCPFIPSWIGEHYNNEIRNYSVVNEFAPMHTGFLQNHINLSLEFFNRSYISPACHGWNHSEDLAHANLSFAYKIVNYTLWNWYNNYHIRPNFWLGHSSTGNYNISLALKRFSDTYWTVYAEGFTGLNSEGKFPDGTSPAIEYIGGSCDPLFGCDFGDPCTTLAEAQQLFTDYSLDKEIIFIRGHPSILNDPGHLNDLYLWQEWIDWIYQEHELININHTQAIEYKIDRNNFIVKRNNGGNYTINLSQCQFNHNVLFTPPDNDGSRWILHDENGNVIGEIQGDVFLYLEKGHCYYFTRFTNT